MENNEFYLIAGGMAVIFLASSADLGGALSGIANNGLLFVGGLAFMTLAVKPARH